MYIYDFGVGQPVSPAPTVSVVGGVQQFSADAARLLQTLFTNQYPELRSSVLIATGIAQPAFDPNADLWVYTARTLRAGAAPPSNQTVYDQLQSMPDKSLFLVDITDAQRAIAGEDVDVGYVIAKNQDIVRRVAAPNAVFAGEVFNFARLLPPTAAPIATTTPKPSTMSAAVPIVAGLSAIAILALIASAA